MDREYEVFKTFNEKLKEARIDITVICVGGFVLSHYGMRTTQDVDGFYRTSKKSKKSSKKLAMSLGLIL